MMRDMTDIVCLHTAGEIEIGHCSPDAIETCQNKYGNTCRWWKNSIYISFLWNPRENNH